jgi:DNA-binding CsgD family transcriptional regulator
VTTNTVPEELMDVSLTTREIQVVRLLAKGLVPKQIGDTLNIATNTAWFHINNAIEKLGATRYTITYKAHQMGLVP